MRNRIILKDIVRAALAQAPCADMDIAEIALLIDDALNAKNLEHYITSTGCGDIIVQAGTQTVQVQPYHNIKPREDLPTPETSALHERQNHASREFRRIQENKYRAIGKHFNSRKK